MLIIFDLDDTLIDTSGSILPFKLKECLKQLVARGLAVGDFEAAYEELVWANTRAGRSEDTLVAFVKKFGKDDAFASGVLDELTKPLPSNFSVATTPYAKEILECLKTTHTLSLVTGGYAPFQMEKLEKAGIDRSIFSKIAVSENSIKKPFYEDLIQEFSTLPQEAVVCGDRVQIDLEPARELGMKTVHMRWGRGRQVPKEDWMDAQIENLRELQGILLR
ncbi:MAG: hypothetical protein ACD_17C00147G0004 [uncultured bacterium]|nr:MAG: hypothetical protein ACD_17C00147G0004 [uncultured bacterium]OGN59627.1 MAG: hypothetical protein A3D96_06280 [Chlamydiae bacterium RIFCSPHIGHO2_12_FULL_44_59]OGN65717.1 MAG: hypothetical protein A2978_07275 [Chlamydiae bacterium RIFCSPLOWO2_01_FULL_44_52]OGN69350.1 MAG: hypothetical protein A3F79_06490 [Chlamydiae bacterium RIFCSPLOWO2_12_FULL_45_20]